MWSAPTITRAPTSTWSLSRLCAATLIAVTIGVVALLGSRAEGAGSFTYRGTTSQGRPIFFLVYGGSVNNMWLRIVDTCPKHRELFVTDRDVPPIQIKRRKFSGDFHAHGSVATLSISGRVSGRVVRGVLTDRTQSARTHKLCAGRATFKLHPS